MPTTPDTASSSFRTYRWRTGSQRHTLQDYVFGFTYAVTEGGFTELTVSSRYAENLRTQLLLEGVDLFDILAERGMLVLHSSYVLRAEGDAILFSGASGIGKSTQAELWREPPRASSTATVRWLTLTAAWRTGFSILARPEYVRITARRYARLSCRSSGRRTAFSCRHIARRSCGC